MKKTAILIIVAITTALMISACRENEQEKQPENKSDIAKETGSMANIPRIQIQMNDSKEKK